MRRTLGTTVFSGMIGVTIFGIFLTPVFFYVIDRLSGARLFHLKWVERISQTVLWIISLRFLKGLVRRPRPLVTAAPSTNGHGTNGHAPNASEIEAPVPLKTVSAPTNGANGHGESVSAPTNGANGHGGSAAAPTNGANGHGGSASADSGGTVSGAAEPAKKPNGTAPHSHATSPASNGHVPPISRPDGPLTPR
jgi:multidrug efflux pump